mgnify:FL=1
MLIVGESAFLLTVQDPGRTGWRRYGVPAAGPMDAFAFRAANALAGNPTGAAALEIGLGGCRLQAGADLLAVVTGAGFALRLDNRPAPLWMLLRVRRGQTLSLHPMPGGCWAYLAVSGGLDVPPVLGSRAYSPALGQAVHPPLQAGDAIATGRPVRAVYPGRFLPPEARPAYRDLPTLEIIPGPQLEAFTLEGQAAFLFGEYAVRMDSDRMGYRLEGPPIGHHDGADITSQGLAIGTVQVPASGQPMVMMSDAPTTGGYTQIAAVVSADLPLLAQCPPGMGRVRFRQTTVAAAQARWRWLVHGLETSIREPEEDSLGWVDGA